MWILILTLQFLVYMAIWQVNYSPLTQLVLYELRKIALGEYLDDLEIGKWLSEAFRINWDD